MVVLLALLAVKATLRTRKNILVAASSLFYAAWDWRYLGLLALISMIDYVCAEKIHASEDLRRRKIWVTFSVVSNLAILGYFKYFNFFLSDLNGVVSSLGLHLPYQEILLPAGISFYTFKSMSYTLDVYRRHIKPCANYLDYAMFITFFPELIAGPIVRASVFLPQMERQPGPTWERMKIGLGLFFLGMIKKRVIADHLAGFVDPIYAEAHIYGSATIWLAVLAYSLQIYCDFSGYSDMAIGSAKLIGYELPENFNMPYLSANITVFWRRWHMTLSNWLRDYLYIPLGGNRKGRVRTYVNLFLTMLLGGLWHGASWNFVVWGALHGAALALHKVWSGRHPKGILPAWLGRIVTFLFATLCWVPFRAPTFAVTATVLQRLFVPTNGAELFSPVVLSLFCLVAVGHAAGWLIDRAPEPPVWLSRLGLIRQQSRVTGWSLSYAGGGVLPWFFMTMVAVGIFWTAVFESSPFIYFQF